MALTMFTRLVVGLLFALLSLSNSVAHTQKALETEMVVDGIAASGLDAVSVNKELFVGVPATASTRNKKLGGRKMAAGKVLMKDSILKEEAWNGGTPNPKISGGDKNASKSSIGRLLKNMNDQPILKEVQGKPVELPNTTNQLRYHESKAASTCDKLECSSRSKGSGSVEFYYAFQKIERQKLLQAANELVALIHKDYSANKKPRHSPPINNGVSMKP
ncbi:PREDICTED: uncharacterized protein LOC104597853 isoform X2 [Nelumbo nucifera]|uniref:Uncharacterized protein LOC104597853 isoform X2 n=1 Tax=Nelumbo nucifera TaxID=4432 RepID=A0A1U8A8P1_NELNU|nr:PREDICTED: uncharacterized protein LOC104597853 isoform X2 [Nelumbo nucifera]